MTKMTKFLGSFVFLWGAIISIYFSVVAPIINQHNDNIFFPVKSLFSSNEYEVSINQLVGKTSAPLPEETKQAPIPESDPIYLLVLDESLSIPWNTRMPDRYLNTVNVLCARRDKIFDHYRNSCLGFDLCKMTLFQVLLDIENQNACFAVLKVGDTTEKIYPMQRNLLYCRADSGNIIDAIEIIEKQNPKSETINTNFISLFTHIMGDYLNKPSLSPEQKHLPLYSLIIISDLIHDMENAIETQLRESNQYTEANFQNALRTNRQTLIELTEQLLTNNSLAHILITWDNVPEKQNPRKVYLWDIMNKKNRKFPPQKIPIEKYTSLNLMFPKPCTEGITFYHNGNKMENQEITSKLKINQAGDYKMALRFSNHQPPDGKIRYQILNPDGKPSSKDGCSGLLDFNGDITHLSQLDVNQIIQLNYSREIPANDNALELILYLPKEERQCFFVPIVFKKKLTAANKFIILLLILFPILYIISFLQRKHLGNLVQNCKGCLFSRIDKHFRK